MKKRFLSMLVLLAAVATGAWADTTVTWSASDMTDLFIDFEEGSAAHNTIKGITVTASSGGNGAWQGNNISMDEGSTTITFTSSVGNIKSIAITAQSIYSYGDTPSGWTMPDYKNLSWSGDASPTVSMTLSDWTEFSNISEIVFTIGPAAPAASTYSVTLAEGTEDGDKWTVKVGEGEAQVFPVEGLNGGETVTATYSGTKKVKSVKAVKKALDPAKAYMTWDADQKQLVATEIPAEVTTVENSNAGVEWQAGTYVVDGEVTINGGITLKGKVDLIIKDGAKLTALKIFGTSNNISIYGQAQMTGELVVNNSGDDATTSIKTLEVYSAKVKASSSYNNRGGFYYIGTINVYGGSVDATAANGYGIWLRPDGSINIYGGEVKAVGKGTGNDSYGIKAGNSSTVTVYGGKLWAENANKQAIDTSKVTLKKGDGFTGKIETSADNSAWTEYTEAATPTTKYVRVGY